MKRKHDSNDSQGCKLVGKRVDEAKSQELGPSFADLPSAITSHILLKLPIKSLLICRCVCKTWKVVTSDPHFTRLHFQRSSASVLIRTNDLERVSRTLHLLEYEPLGFLDYEPKKFNEGHPWCFCRDFVKPGCNDHLKLELKFKLPLRDVKFELNKVDEAKNPSRERRYRKPEDDKFEVVNSCNGILCLCGPTIKDPLVVCNPITGEFMKLPESSEIKKSQVPTFDFYVGFGFQPNTNEYKVIRMWKRVLKTPIYTRRWKFCEPIVEIHTLGTPTWRNVGVDPTFNFDRLTFPSYLNGALHWVRFNASETETSILCLNFESERFQSFPSPPCLIENNQISDSTFSMGELWGVLYICDASNLFDPITIWIMEEYGIGESWTKIFHLGQYVELRWPIGLHLPVKHFKIGAGILMHYTCDCFIYCESENYGFKLYKVRGTKSKFEVIPHIPSLISLKDTVKGDNVKVLNVHSRCGKFKLQEENEVLFLAEENVELAIIYASAVPAEEE